MTLKSPQYLSRAFFILWTEVAAVYRHGDV